MNRRDFIKVSSTIGAATAIEASTLQSLTENTLYDEQEMLTSNRFGAFYVKKRGGEIVSVRPFEGDKCPSPLINAFADNLKNDSRVEYPMVRKSYLKAQGPSNPQLRGKEEFVRVSWDVALDLVAKQMKKTFNQYGPESIYGDCYWWGGSGKVGYGQTVARRMMKILGGFVEESGDYSTGAGLVIMPHIVGDLAVYDSPTKWKAIIKYAKNVVFWGTDPVNTNQISYEIPLHHSYKDMELLKHAIKEGKIKAYSVDVKQNDTQRFMNSIFLSIIPNTDTAMMIGMAHYLYENKLYDEDFIKRYTVGFAKFKNYLIGKDDGVVKDIHWAEKICGIKADSIAKFADILAKEPSIILVGRALQRQDHGEQQFWMITVLSAMLGHIGKPGCGVEFSLAYDASGSVDKKAPILQGISSVTIDPQYTTKYPDAPWTKHENVVIPSSRWVDAIANPGKEIDHNGAKIKLPHIRLMYNASGSLFTRHHNVNNLLKQLQKVETVITADPYWTSTCKMSDIVLPVATELERIDIDQSCWTREYFFGRKIVSDPIGESQSDFWICKEICKRWGHEDVFTEGKDELGWVKYIYADAVDQAKVLNVPMPSFEEFWEKGYVQFNEDDTETDYYTRWESFRQDPYQNRLGTPSGKIEIYSPVIEKFGYNDCKGHPMWFEPIEWLGKKEVVKKYPIHIVSSHSKYRLHSQLNNSYIRTFAEVSGREPLLLHPDNAKERGLKTGDIVRIFNDRGEVLAGVLITPTVRKDVGIISEGAWYDPNKPGEASLCQHGNINVLTIDKGTSKLAQSNISHTTLVQVEKYKGEILPIQAFNKPKIIQSL